MKQTDEKTRFLTEVGTTSRALLAKEQGVAPGSGAGGKRQSCIPALPRTAQEPEGMSSLQQVFDFSSCQRWTTLQQYGEPYKSEGIKDLEGSMNVRWENKIHWYFYIVGTGQDWMSTTLGLSAQVSHTLQGQASSGIPNSNHLGFLSWDDSTVSLTILFL